MAECAPFMALRLALATSILVLLSCAADRTAAQTDSRAPAASGSRAPAAAAAPAGAVLVEPTGIRLPPSFRPTAQRVSLVIVPASPTFSGTTEIDATLAEPTDIVWLNADALEVT